jgi:hypothetical protein
MNDKIVYFLLKEREREREREEEDHAKSMSSILIEPHSVRVTSVNAWLALSVRFLKNDQWIYFMLAIFV